MKDSQHTVVQYNDYETSTMKCSCGASLTWSNGDDRVSVFIAKHGRPTQQITTEDGAR